MDENECHVCYLSELGDFLLNFSFFWAVGSQISEFFFVSQISDFFWFDEFGGQFCFTAGLSRGRRKEQKNHKVGN